MLYSPSWSTPAMSVAVFMTATDPNVMTVAASGWVRRHGSANSSTTETDGLRQRNVPRTENASAAQGNNNAHSNAMYNDPMSWAAGFLTPTLKCVRFRVLVANCCQPLRPLFRDRRAKKGLIGKL